MACFFSRASHTFQEHTERIKKETTRSDCRWTAPMRADGSLNSSMASGERRSRTIASPAARLALTCPEVFQLAVEGLVRRHRWAAAIRG